jgi:hypothetical protein
MTLFIEKIPTSNEEYVLLLLQIGNNGYQNLVFDQDFDLKPCAKSMF